MSKLHKRGVSELTRHLKGFIAYTILIVSVRMSVARVLHVNRCPTCETEWTERAVNMSCDTDNGLYYHCILDTEDNLVELCLAKRPISAGKEGCPIVYLTGNSAIHEGENSPCPSTNKFCPMRNKVYYTNQLYIFPICFLNTSMPPTRPKRKTKSQYARPQPTKSAADPGSANSLAARTGQSQTPDQELQVAPPQPAETIPVAPTQSVARSASEGESLSCNGQQSTPLTPGIGRMEES